jgi:hypothetical protein
MAVRHFIRESRRSYSSDKNIKISKEDKQSVKCLKIKENDARVINKSLKRISWRYNRHNKINKRKYKDRINKKLVVHRK